MTTIVVPAITKAPDLRAFVQGCLEAHHLVSTYGAISEYWPFTEDLVLRVCAFVSPYLPGLDGRPLIEDCLVAGGKVFRRRERQDHCDEALVRDGIRAMLLPLDAVRHWEVRVGDAIWSPSDGPLMAFVTARGGEIALSERDGGDYLPEVILHDALRQCVFTAFYERDLRIKFTDLLA